MGYAEFDDLGFADAPSPRDARLYDADLELGRGNPEDVLRLLENHQDFRELASKIAACIRRRTSDPKGGALLAADDLREYLAELMVKGAA